jgi:hypothetical protein
MLSDVRAAREKNGIYISHERFVQEEAEKKVHALKEDENGIIHLYITFHAQLHLTILFIQAMRENIEQLELLLDQKKKA